MSPENFHINIDKIRTLKKIDNIRYYYLFGKVIGAGTYGQVRRAVHR